MINVNVILKIPEHFGYTSLRILKSISLTFYIYIFIHNSSFYFFPA